MESVNGNDDFLKHQQFDVCSKCLQISMFKKGVCQCNAKTYSYWHIYHFFKKDLPEIPRIGSKIDSKRITEIKAINLFDLIGTAPYWGRDT